MKVFNVLLILLFTASLLPAQRNLNYHQTLENIYSIFEGNDKIGMGRDFKKLPDTIYYNYYHDNNITPHTYLLHYNGDKITSIELDDNFDKYVFKFEYDSEGRRTFGEEFKIINGDEVRQAGIEYHYDEDGIVTFVGRTNNGNLVADSLEIIKINGKVNSFKLLSWQPAPENNWQFVHERLNCQYNSDQLVGFETKQLSFDGSEILHHKYENLKTLQSQKIEILPRLVSYFNFDTSFLQHYVLSAYNAGNILFSSFLQGDIYKLDEVSGEFVKFSSSKIVQEGNENVVNSLNPMNENEILGKESYFLDEDHKLIHFKSENIVNGFEYNNFYQYGPNGRISSSAAVGENSDTLSITDYQYFYNEEDELLIFEEVSRFGSVVDRRFNYRFGYKTSADTKNIQSKTIGLYPNPSKSTVQIQTDEEIISVRITDVHGKNVRSVFPDGNQISIEDLMPGPYYIKVKLKSGTYLSQLIKI